MKESSRKSMRVYLTISRCRDSTINQRQAPLHREAGPLVYGTSRNEVPIIYINFECTPLCLPKDNYSVSSLYLNFIDRLP